MGVVRNLDRWLWGYGRALGRRWATGHPQRPGHVLFALCDHFEPLWGGADDKVGEERVQRWLEAYPRFVRELRDADGLELRDTDGRPPRHTFFFPIEQYRQELLEPLAALTRAGLGEVELHLHHDGDTAETLRALIAEGIQAFSRHGLLGSDDSGRRRYGFIHGNWCLANSRRDGRWCGVDSELEVLFETGCYADFTFPSAPDETQPALVNQIYWPTGDPGRARAHQRGVPARVGQAMFDRILMVQGPLCLSGGGRLGVRIDSGALTARDPASPRRVRSWLGQQIRVQGRPEWIFVKVHAHGAPEEQARALLGSGGRALHQALARECRQQNASLHYVTAREMFNIALSAMEGLQGNPDLYRDYALDRPEVAS